MPPAKRKTTRKSGPKAVPEPTPIPVEMPPGPPSDSYSVEPGRIAAKLHEQLNEKNLELAMTKAAFEQRGEELQARQRTIDQLNGELAELRAKYEPEDEEEPEEEVS